MTLPLMLVLDDVHLLLNRECRAALSVLAEYVPVGSRLAFAGRGEPPLRIPRLQAGGRITEVGPGERRGIGIVAEVHRREGVDLRPGPGETKKSM